MHVLFEALTFPIVVVDRKVKSSYKRTPVQSRKQMLNTETLQPYTSRFDLPQTELLYEQMNSMDSASLNMSHSSSALSSSALSGAYESDQQQQQLNQQQSQQNSQQPNQLHQLHYQPQQLESIKQEPHYVDLQQMYVPANGQQQQQQQQQQLTPQQQQQLSISNQLAMAGGHSMAQSAAMHHQLTNSSHMPSGTSLTNSSSEYKISSATVNTSSATGNSSTSNGSTANAERIRRPMNACEWSAPNDDLKPVIDEP